MLFFPEIIPAAVLLLVAPIWTISFILDRQFTAALMLAVGIAIFACGFFKFIEQGRKYLAYFAMLGALVVALLVLALASAA